MAFQTPADLDIIARGEQLAQRPFQNLSDIDGITHDFFIGRPNVWELLKENILRPKKLQHNIVWLSGPAGSGKTVVIKGLNKAAETFSNFVVIPLSAATTDPLNLLWEVAERLKENGYPLNKFARKYAEFTRDSPKLEIEEKAEEELVKSGVDAFINFLGWVFLKPFQKTVVPLFKVLRATVKYRWQQSRQVEEVRKGKQLTNKQAFLTKVFIQNLNQVTGSRPRGLFRWRKGWRRVFLIFDPFEEWRTDVSPWLLDSVLREIANTQIVVVVPSLNKFHIALPGALETLPQPNVILQIPLNYFQKEETRVFLRELRISDEADVERIHEFTGGSLFYLRLLQFMRGDTNPNRSIDENFLDMFNQQQREVLLAAALFSRPFAENDLAAIPSVQAADHANSYTWLIRLPFVVPRFTDGRYSYTQKAQELFGDPERWPTRMAYYATRQALADHYRKQLADARKALGKGAYHSAECLELALAFAFQQFFLEESIHHLAAVEQLTLAYQQNPQTGRTILKTLEKLCQYPPPHPRSVPAYDLIQHLMRFINADLSGNEEEMLSASNELLGRLAATTTNLLRAGRPGIASIYLRRGKIHLAQKNYPAARQDFTDATTLDRWSAQAYASRGETSYQEYISQLAPYQSGVTPGELQLALDDLTQACKLDPHSARAYLFRGRIYHRYGVHLQAINDFTEALKYDRDSPELPHERGLAYRNLRTLEGYRKAVADFNTAIMLKNDFAEAYADRGITYREQKEFGSALPEFDKALKLNPDLAWARAHRGRTYRKVLDYERAVEDLDWAINQNFRPYWVYLHRGIANLGLGRLDLAIKDFAESSRLKPTDTNARWMEEWAKMCRDAKDAGIIDRLRSIAQIDPEQYAALVCTGVALWFEDEFDQALEALEAALAQDSDEWDAPFWKGMVCACLDMSLEALKMLDQSLNSGLPPILLHPLHWLNEKNSVFYTQHARLLLEKHGTSMQN